MSKELLEEERHSSEGAIRKLLRVVCTGLRLVGVRVWEILCRCANLVEHNLRLKWLLIGVVLGCTLTVYFTCNGSL